MSKDLVVPKITKGSLAGQVIEADYDGFVAIIEASDNEADVFAKVDNTLASNIEAGKDLKRAVDLELKKFKQGEIRLREYTTQYMGEKGIKKLEGATLKSITFQEAKKVIKTVSDKQIMVKRKYVSLGDLSKDDLVKMLEEKGVKTRSIASEVTEEKSAGIRVTR